MKILKRNIRLICTVLFCFLFLNILLLPASAAEIQEYGTAIHPSGRTAVISVFADDTTTYWNYDNSEDVSAMYRSLDRLGIACKWLEEQFAQYGVTTELLYDWSEINELFYRAYFDSSMIELGSDTYYTKRNYLYENVNADILKEMLDVDNIIYVMFFNTKNGNSVSPRTHSWLNGYSIDYEIINGYLFWDEWEMLTATYAHEILHCFGVPDLYYASESPWIPQNFVDHCSASGCDDIMFATYISDEIVNSFSELDAYYAGLTDYSEQVNSWGLNTRYGAPSPYYSFPE